LAESKAQVDFTQGLDARLLTDKNIEVLKRIKVKRIHFAWDNPKDTKCQQALERFADVWGMKPNDKQITVYVLTNYWSTTEEDLFRVYWLRSKGFAPYIMIYDKPHAPREILHMQRWCNSKFIFYAVKDFNDYKRRTL